MLSRGTDNNIFHMTSLVQIADLARATLKRLSESRLPPTPENYSRVYAEIANRAPQSTPVIDADSTFGRSVRFPAAAAGHVPWGALLLNLLSEWERSQAGLTQLQKRQAIDDLGAATSPPQDAATLQQKITQLLKRWAALPSRQAVKGNVGETTIQEAATDAPWRQLWGQSLKYGLLSFCLDADLQSRVQELIALAERGDTAETVNPAILTTQNRELWLKWERLRAEDEAVRDGLVGLFDLVLGNLGEFLAQDHWISVQMAAIQDILRPPLDTGRLEQAQGSLKQLLFRQGVLHKSADEARATAKELIGMVVRNLAAYAEHSANYNRALDGDLQRLEASNDWDEIRRVVQGILAQSREMQERSGKLGGQLEQAQRQAAEAQERIQSLEGELKQASQKLQEDPLTGALNRRGLDVAFARDMSRAERQHQPLSVALLDLDHFKRINDTYGHDLGDEVLRSLVQLTRRVMRPTDNIARMGGEEFMLLLPDAGADRAWGVVERLLEAFCHQRVMHQHTGQRVEATFSAGIAEWCVGEDFAGLYQRADTALLAAKQAGRQCLMQAAPCAKSDKLHAEVG